MKNKVILILLFFSVIFVITGCSANQVTNENPIEENNNTINEGNEAKMNNIKVTINNKVYDVVLEDNETVEAFINLLPQELNMNELNGNEKYFYMDTSLPTKVINPKQIEAGDIMLYGNDCLVIFYKSFNTSYSYTKIGHINDLPDLGSSNVSVIFEIN